MTRPALDPPAPPTTIADALQRIRDHGGRVTAGKRALAELLYTEAHPLRADEIVGRLVDHDRSAVYRNLAQFEQLGIVEHLHLGHGHAVYRAAGQGTVPVVCSTCHAGVDLDRRHTVEFVGLVARLTGIEIDLTHFPLTGTCARCRGRHDTPSAD